MKFTYIEVELVSHFFSTAEEKTQASLNENICPQIVCYL